MEAALELDARIWVREACRTERRPVTLASLSSSSLAAIADLGFRWVWLRGAWDSGAASREIARRSAALIEELQEALPDLRLEDIDGPPLPVREYHVRQDLGGDEALERLRADLLALGVHVLVDVSPASVAPDHPWVGEHPEFFIRGGQEAAASRPRDWFRAPGGAIFARASPGGAILPGAPSSGAILGGASPNGDPSPPALQLNLRHAGLREALLAALEEVAARVDGVCLCGPGLSSPSSLLERWGEVSLPQDGSRPVDVPFQAEAVSRLRLGRPHLRILGDEPAEASGAGVFDHALDGRLPALLSTGDVELLAEHLEATAGRRLGRRLESASGRRAAEVFDPARHAAAAIIAYLPAGMAIFTDGEIDGRKRPQSLLLSRRSSEPPDRDLRSFYERLLEVLGRPEVSRGEWRMLRAKEAWDGNVTWRQFIAFAHTGPAGESLLSAINYGPAPGQCYIEIDGLDCRGKGWRLQDLFSLQVYSRDGDELSLRGLYLDLPAWDYNVFELRPEG